MWAAKVRFRHQGRLVAHNPSPGCYIPLKKVCCLPVSAPKPMFGARRKSELLLCEDTAMPAAFRSMRAEDRELFKSFIRSVPRKDGCYLLADVHNDQTIDRRMDRLESGQIMNVLALEDGQMIGHHNLRTIGRGLNKLWARPSFPASLRRKMA